VHHQAKAERLEHCVLRRLMRFTHHGPRPAVPARLRRRWRLGSPRLGEADGPPEVVTKDPGRATPRAP